MENTNRNLTLNVNAQKRSLKRFTDGLCQDIEFIASTLETNKLLSGVADEGMDEVDYWRESLGTVYQVFIANRQKYTEVNFSIDGQTTPILGVEFKDGETKLKDSLSSSQIADGAQEIASSSNLSEQAAQLFKVISIFKTSGEETR